MTAKCKFHKKCFRKGIQILNASICLMLCVLCFVDCRLATPVPFKVDVIDNLHLFNLKTLDATLDHGAVRSKRQLTSPLSVLNLGECMQKSSCRDAKNITSHTQGNKNVFFVATHTNIMKVTISNGPKKTCTCSIIHNGTNPVLSIATDESNVYWLTSNRSKLMYFPIRRQVSSPLVLTLSQEMHAEYIPHRNAACRIPFYVPDIPNPKLTRANYLEFDLSKIHQRQQSWFSSKICIHENNPNISYAFLYMNLSGNRKKHSIQQSCSGTFDCIYLRVNATSSLESIRLKNLISNSAYLVHVIVFSETKNYKSAVISPGKRFKTACEVPGTVQNLQCTGIDDKNICLSWDKANNVNPEGVRYEVYRNQNTTPKYISNNNAHQSLIFASPPDLMNSFLVKSFAVNCSEIANQYSHFTIQSCQSLQPPQPLQVQEVTGMQATVKWNAPSDGSALYVIIQWAMRISQSTHISWSESEKLNGSDSLIYKVTDLVPNSGYDFRTYQQYIGYTGGEGWRYSEITTAMTAAGVPSFPPSVYVERESDRSFFNWETPNSNGKDLEYYVIEYRNRSSPNATRVLYGSWQSARSISASFNRWQLEKLNENLWYEFRVSAVNAVGHGDVSQPSDPFYYYSIEIAEDDHTMWIVVGTTAGMVLLLFVIILCVACRRCGKETTVVQSPPSSEITTIHLSYGTDLQLAEIRHINDLANLKGIPNIPQDYMDLLPLFPRDKLTLTDFLGRGAFGEVFKGIAHDVDINLGTGRAVAVKTLREGATDSEKCEFLMEAYFMSNFNHENILSLIGVCLDNEPQYLILELMEGGDLLHYVRDARPNPIMGPKLNTASLLDICIDVAAGCKYLEEQRFVHRDLAARNCLVSTRSYRSHQRVVKIGDFGLARDIYRNDYYHKAGEGLLPVRWMAPESLVDNIYTTQSDVWSFGVLVWEIMTFGQQPYPARSNLEVLQLVRTGGRLDKPDNCPSDIHALMMKCWHKTPSLRPTFGWALQWLQDFKDRSSHLLVRNNSTTEKCIVNYTTVTTSEEDIVDNDSMTSSELRAMEHHFRASVMEFNNEVCMRQDEYDEHSTPDEENATSLIYRGGNVLAQNPVHVAHDSSYLHVHQNEELGHMTSRTTTVQQNVMKKVSTQTLFPLHPGIQTSRFLPYKGELPITDEERLMRKRYWKCQLKSSPVCLDNSRASVAKRKDYQFTHSPTNVSPFLCFENSFPIDTSNQNSNNSNIVGLSSNHFNFDSRAVSEMTQPKQTFESNFAMRDNSNGENHDFSLEYAQIGIAGDNFLSIVPMKRGHEDDSEEQLSSPKIGHSHLSGSKRSKSEDIASNSLEIADNSGRGLSNSSIDEVRMSTYV